MIVNLFVSDVHFLSCVASKDFKILKVHHQSLFGSTLFTVETTEEHMAFLKLKFGSECVWKRL